MLIKTLVLVSALITGTSAIGSSPRLSPFGIVEGITDCGSNGKLGVVQATDCTTLPCQLIPYNLYDFSILFTASVTVGSNILFLEVVNYDNFTTLFYLYINGEIEAGKEYELKFQITVSNELSGKEFPIRFYVLDFANRRYEICASASIKVL